MDQKTIKMLGYIIGGFVSFIILLFLISSCTNKKYTFEKLENRMLKIAKEMYENDDKELPQQDKDTKTITLKKMISDGKIEEVSKLFKRDDLKCNGSVTITNNNGYYNYSPYLSCGKEYETTYLKDKIIDNSLVETGVGLHEIKDTYVMRGEVKDNFIKFNGNTYRIIRINSDGTIRIMEQKGLIQKVWDDRYNIENSNNSGINEYEYNSLNSRIRDTLIEYYLDSKTWPDEIKQYITTQTLCIGKRTKADITKDGSTECSKVMENEAFGLLSIYEFLQASLDANCSYTNDGNCRNYNWISNLKNSTWSITANAEDNKTAYLINGIPKVSTCSSMSGTLAVFNITDKAIYVKGDGTEENPYEFK